MWMIADTGFVSVVEYEPKRDKTNQLPDVLRELPANATRKQKQQFNRWTRDGFVLARARVHDDLEQLRPYFPPMEIREETHADYKFRAVLPRVAFAQFCYDKAMAIDYNSHFKEVNRDRAPADPNRYSAMMGTWSELNRMGRPKYEPKWYGESSYSSASGKHSKKDGHGRPQPGNSNSPGGFGGGTGGYPSYGYGTQQALPSGSQPGPVVRNPFGHNTDTVDVLKDVDPPEGPNTIKDMLGALTQSPPDEIVVSTATDDLPFFLWSTAAELFKGQSSGLDTAQRIELILECLANGARDDEVGPLESALVELQDAAADEDEAADDPDPVVETETPSTKV